MKLLGFQIDTKSIVTAVIAGVVVTAIWEFAIKPNVKRNSENEG